MSIRPAKVNVSDQLGGNKHIEAESRVWYPGIEALRGIAAYAVVMDHSWTLGNGNEAFALGIVQGLGSWGVNLFFLLSGYLLADFFWPATGKRSTLEFYVRRIFRIGPAYWVCVILLFLFFADHSLLFSPQGLKQVLAQMTFTQWLWPSTSSDLNVDGALWTLTIEMMLYAFMPIMAWCIAKRPVAGSLALAALGIAYRLVVALDGQWLARWRFGSNSAVPPEIQRLFLSRQFLGLLPIFVLGMALRWAVLHGWFAWWYSFWDRFSSKPSLLILLLLLTPSLAFLKNIDRASDYQHWIRFTFFDYALCLLAVPALLYASRPVRGELSPLMRGGVWAGERSYGIYLWHFPVILAVYGMGPLLHPPDTAHLALKIISIFVIATLLGWGSYALVERPGREYGRKLARRVGKWRDPKINPKALVTENTAP